MESGELPLEMPPGMQDILTFLNSLKGQSGALDPKRKELIDNLPSLNEADLLRLDKKDSCCPICFTPFLAVLASEEMALAMDSPATATQDLGVTRLADTCGHLFCRKDISIWMRQNDSCPTCRRPYISRREADATREPGLLGLTGDNSALFSEDGYVDEALFDRIAGASPTVDPNMTMEDRIREMFENHPFLRPDFSNEGGEVRQGSDRSRRENETRDDFVGLYS